MPSPSSSYSHKRKTTDTFEDTKKALEDARKEVKQGKELLNAILHIVKEKMKKREEAHDVKVMLERKRAKRSVVVNIMNGQLKNLHIAADKYADETANLSAMLKEVEIPDINWSKLEISFM